MIGHARSLQVGPLSALFVDGDLRYLRVGGVEVVRRIYVAVRDDAWRTVPVELSDLNVVEGQSEWSCRFRAEHRAGPIDLAWDGSIHVRAAISGTPAEIVTRFEMNGSARSSFLTNRTGLCVLHPLIETAGRPCRVEHADGTSDASAFPRLVSPHQPFFDVRALSHEPADGLRVEVRFDGEVFETEDQRNWADGSFKTYGRPLARPFPYRLEAGATVCQAVTVRVTESPSVADGENKPAAQARVQKPAAQARVQKPAAKARDQAPAQSPRRVTHDTRDQSWVQVRVGEAAGPLPELGLSVPPDAPLDSSTRKDLSAIVSHFRFDLRPSHPNSDQRLREILRRADDDSFGVELALHLDAGATVPAAMIDALTKSRSIRRLILFDDGAESTPPATAHRCREQLDAQGVNLPIGGGPVANFTELNRNRPPAGVFDWLSYPICPQIHATDSYSLIENLEALEQQVATARSFAPDVALSVGPIRFHRPDPTAPHLADPRQKGAIGAAWLLGAIARLSLAQVQSITLYEAFGPRGVRDVAGPFPSWHLLETIRSFGPADVMRVEVDAPLELAALALRRDGKIRLLLANLTGSARTTVLAPLDQTSDDRPISLEPWGIVVLDIETNST